jgi:hypothetical protein
MTLHDHAATAVREGGVPLMLVPAGLAVALADGYLAFLGACMQREDEVAQGRRGGVDG